MINPVRFRINGAWVSVHVDPLMRAVDVFRDTLGLTGTKEGCGEGECGACSVLLDGRLVNSCLIPVGALEGRDVVTIEGYRKTARYALLKECFSEAGAVQCGFCTPGMMLAAEALLSVNPHPDEAAVREALSGNLCRCTGYSAIVAAVMSAARSGGGLW
ncbi:MAG TPA: (2Fe-2S)-binding protein [Bacillota bacterium]|nr:(2Fe-2S)-binding protein [Bacillota bacterium]HOA15523.1 (2Fe-2S)-binding protein [Bacillota bacterium]HOG52450.1 (2Fe-2S)-binding protein [Bacillota bacterium]